MIGEYAFYNMVICIIYTDLNSCDDSYIELGRVLRSIMYAKKKI